MFRCDAFRTLDREKAVSKAGEPCFKVVVERREKTYYNEIEGEREPKVTHGWEIVKEAKLCAEAKKLFDEGKIKYEHGRFVAVR